MFLLLTASTSLSLCPTTLSETVIAVYVMLCYITQVKSDTAFVHMSPDAVLHHKKQEHPNCRDPAVRILLLLLTILLMEPDKNKPFPVMTDR